MGQGAGTRALLDFTTEKLLFELWESTEFEVFTYFDLKQFRDKSEWGNTEILQKYG